MDDKWIYNAKYTNECINMIDLKELAKEIREINKNNGWTPLTKEEWDKEYKIMATLALVHSELSEALEAYRDNVFYTHVENKPEGFIVEMADVFIRLLDCVGAWEDVDFEKIIREKMEYNKTRPYRHGGKKK